MGEHMTDILVFGAQGQLGHQLVQDLKAQNQDVLGLTKQTGDLCNKAMLEALFETHQPTLVFNAAAYNAVDNAASELDLALNINGMGPGRLAVQTKKYKAMLVHFSTDYVFGNGHTKPINESQLPDPLSAYGLSKRLGEETIFRNTDRAIVLRCCGLYSERRHNFIRTMIRVALMGKPLTVVNDQFVCPTWVSPLSQVAIKLAQQELNGIYHAVSHDSCSWYDYAAKIFAHLDIDADLSPVSQNDWAAKAPRPEYSVLDNALLRILNLDDFEPWDVMLVRFLDQFGQQIINEEMQKLKV